MLWKTVQSILFIMAVLAFVAGEIMDEGYRKSHVSWEIDESWKPFLVAKIAIALFVIVSMPAAYRRALRPAMVRAVRIWDGASARVKAEAAAIKDDAQKPPST